MEYALQKLPVLANDLSPLIHNPFLVYSFLAVYGVMFLLLATYVHAKFRTASKTLQLLQTEWQSAESKHANLANVAQEHLSKLTAPASAPTPLVRNTGIGFDIRNQIVNMAKRGITVNDIARKCGLQEGEVDVILGMARLQR
jgi:hypothetical protein